MPKKEENKNLLVGRYYRLRQSVIDEMEGYLKENPSIKKEGLVEQAILEYIARRK